MKCRHCAADLELPFIDLGTAPPSNAYLPEHALRLPEVWLPLRVLVCARCWLVQTEDFARADELFTAEYAYFSGFSRSWLAHARRYVDDMIARFGLGARSHVVEIAANDGYLLQYVKAAGIPCTGVEPTASTAAAAREKGIPIIEDFFGRRLSQQMSGRGLFADLIAANNVLAHVPDIGDFVGGFAMLLKPQGVATFEFPHVMRLVAECQFDTIYHEHYSYLSLTAVGEIFSANGLTVFDVEEHSTHGGSLRVFAQRSDTGTHPRTRAVDTLLAAETAAGMRSAEYYTGFQARAEKVKNDFTQFLMDARRAGDRVAAYGAAAKGNTLLNFAGVRSDLVSFVADQNPAKQGKYMPGSRIPIVPESRLAQDRPRYIILLPWNLKSELVEQLSYTRAWGAQLVIAVPELGVL
jgi:hypothetical protein